jgi:hypothetical protein
MKSTYQVVWMICLSLTVGMFFAGCGYSGKKLKNAEAQINAFSEKGVPDTLLSAAKVFLYNAQTANKFGNSGESRLNGDSLKTAVQRIQVWYDSAMKALKPAVDELTNSVTAKKQDLTGMQQKEADSIYAIAQALVSKNWLLQARDKLSELDGIMASLIDDEKKAQAMKAMIVGTWVGGKKHEAEGYSATERKKVVFSGDGKLDLEEEMKGQTSESLKEDWLFQSAGTWDIKGDTALLHITHEKCLRQTYWSLMNKEGKDQWVKQDKPTYDSTIANGNRDKFLTLAEIKETLKKK